LLEIKVLFLDPQKGKVINSRLWIHQDNMVLIDDSLVVGVQKFRVHPSPKDGRQINILKSFYFHAFSVMGSAFRVHRFPFRVLRFNL
jgi:hypothetical protein